MTNDYKQVFGRNPEVWREPLGALRLTLWADSASGPEWTIARARDEVEWLCRVMNGVTDGSEGPVVMSEMGVERARQ